MKHIPTSELILMLQGAWPHEHVSKLAIDRIFETYGDDWFVEGEEFKLTVENEERKQLFEKLKGYGRKFEEIVVEYPPAEICTYPKYRGKPYFSIKYEENGEHMIGFGTYNPEVLSRYLREYFIAPVVEKEEV